MAVQIKTAEDLALLREGGKILAKILNELEKEAIVGNNTQDVEDRARELIEEHNVIPMILGYDAHFANRPYPAAISVSINDVVVHGIPNENPIEFCEGDIVSLDLVIGYKDMVVDSTRTVIVGEGSNEAKRLVEVTRSALNAGIKAAQAGRHVNDIGIAVQKSVPEGYGIVESFCGHGVGYSLHEDPAVPNFDTGEKGTKLVPGMVLAIEPMITTGSKEVEILKDGYTVATKDGSLSAHMEHTVAITENGPEILTK